MKDETVEEDRREHRPEKEADAVEEPRHFGRRVVQPGDRHEDVPHHGDEPRRVHVRDFVFRVMHPRRHHIERERQVQHGADAPQPEGEARRIVQQRDRQQDHADRDRRAERCLTGWVNSSRTAPGYFTALAAYSTATKKNKPKATQRSTQLGAKPTS